MMAALEQRKLPYLFTLRQSKNVSRTISRLAKQGNKVDWQKVKAGSKGSKQPVLPGTMMEQSGGGWYEYSALVTSWEERDLGRLTQEYRNRADAENMFDELKTPRLEVGAGLGIRRGISRGAS